MPRAYSQMDVLVLPSRTTPTWAEQFGRVLVEALWCGVPVIGSQSGEIPWVVTATGGGALYPESDVDALTDLLRQFAADPDKRGQIARAGRAAVEKLFSVDAVSDLFDGVLRDVAHSTEHREAQGER
jgi:glycosyltransferase involved in cell wall biosynthesis